MTLLLSDYARETCAGERPIATKGERRRGLRIRQNRPVKIFQGVAARYFGGQTQDISSTGLRLELPAGAPLQPGDTVNVHVGPSSSGYALANRRQMMPARIVWVDRNDAIRTGRLNAGIEFLSSIAAQLDAA